MEKAMTPSAGSETPRTALVRLLRQRYQDLGDTTSRKAAEEIETLERELSDATRRAARHNFTLLPTIFESLTFGSDVMINGQLIPAGTIIKFAEPFRLPIV